METTLPQFVLALVFGSCLLVLLLSATSRFLHYRAEKRSLKRRVICRLCLHAFEVFSDEGLVDCPSCHTKNERRGGV